MVILGGRSRHFFMGVPAPAGAFLALAPMALQFRFPDSPLLEDRFVVPYFLFTAFTLVSDVPTFSSKMINRAMFESLWQRALALVLGIAFTYAVYTDLWLVYLLGAAGYVLSFVVSSGTSFPPTARFPVY